MGGKGVKNLPYKNKEDKKVYDKKYYERNKEVIKKRSREWEFRNKEK